MGKLETVKHHEASVAHQKTVHIIADEMQRLTQLGVTRQVDIHSLDKEELKNKLVRLGEDVSDEDTVHIHTKLTKLQCNLNYKVWHDHSTLKWFKCFTIEHCRETTDVHLRTIWVLY